MPDRPIAAQPGLRGFQAAEVPRGPSHYHVLFVEDDIDSREMMAQLLTLEGFQCATVANGKEALDWLRRGTVPDVIVLNLLMPVMDGWEFRRCQKADPTLSRIPVIVLSAAIGRVTRGIEADAILSKPTDFDKLLDLVRRAVERRSLRP